MLIYVLLTGIFLIAVLLIIIILQRRSSISKQGSSNELLPQNQLNTDFIQKLNDLLQKQQTQQEQLIQAQLMNLFRIPKLREISGRRLESQLQEVLPHQHFSIQYTFATGSICDAVVFLPNGKLIPIDSKFSLENFRMMTSAVDENESKEFEKEHNKDVKARINEISCKYILPHEGTIDFAFMFIPAESVYYQTFVEKDNGLREYALQKK